MIAHLVKKDLRKTWLLASIFILFSVLMCSLVFDSEILKGSDYTNTSVMNLAGLLLNMLVFGSLMSIEKYEEKHSGYKMTAPLPVTSAEIVIGKFIVIFFAVVFGILGVLIIYRLFGIGDLRPELRLNYLLLAGSISLVLNGLSYLGIFKYGFHKVRAPIMGVYVLALIVPQLVSFLQLVGERVSFQTAVGNASEPAVAGSIAAAVSLYLVLLYASIKAKESREI